jgi:hypothetical protein
MSAKLTSVAKPKIHFNTIVKSRGVRLTFIQVQIVPPFHGCDITKPEWQFPQHILRTIETDLPHVSNFVRLSDSDSFFCQHVCLLRVKQKGTSTSSDEALLEVSTKARRKRRLIPSSP